MSIKTFVTVIANQGKKLDKDKKPIIDRNGKEERMLELTHYAPSNNSKLAYDKMIHFPIVCAINGYAEKGDTIRIIAIKNENNIDGRPYLLVTRLVITYCLIKPVVISDT